MRVIRTPVSTTTFPQLTSHPMRITVKVTNTSEEERTYLTYTIGGIEGKTENLASEWTQTHDVNVNSEFLAQLYQRPTDVIWWRVQKMEKKAVPKKKKATKKEEIKDGKKSVSASDVSIAEPFEKISKRIQSDSPTRDTFGPTLKKFLNDQDFGYTDIKTSRPNSAKEGPRPHHYDHPEKHVDAPMSRSMSSMSSLNLVHPKTPPSPHHFDHPLTVLAPNGKVSPKEQKPDSKPKQLKWIKSAGLGKTDWKEVSIADSERRANDKPVELENVVSQRRVGDIVHFPLKKGQLDVTGFFFDELTTTLELGPVSITVTLDQPLLSPDQSDVLKPMVIRLENAIGMPASPYSYKEMDKFESVNCSFRFFNDLNIHKVYSDVPHGPEIPFKSRHVILLGLLDLHALKDEFDKGFTVEVRDQEFQAPQDILNFADLRLDGLISRSLNPKNAPGKAFFPLSGLHHSSTLKLTAPILPTLGSSNFLENQAELTIRIMLKSPLSILETPTIQKAILVLPTDNATTFERIMERIRDYNTSLYTTEPIKDKELFLSTQSTHPDAICGYDIFDSENRILLLEGSTTGMANIMNFRDVKCYPSLSYKRIYKPLAPILLHWSLDQKVHWSMNKVSKDCLECLQHLESILKFPRPYTFPSQKMLASLRDCAHCVTSDQSIVRVIRQESATPPMTPPTIKIDQVEQEMIMEQVEVPRQRIRREPNFIQRQVLKYPGKKTKVDRVPYEPIVQPKAYYPPLPYVEFVTKFKPKDKLLTDARRQELSIPWQEKKGFNFMI